MTESFFNIPFLWQRASVIFRSVPMTVTLQNVYSQNVYSQNVYSQNVYSRNVYSLGYSDFVKI
jgi:hypothetical protein